MFMHNLSMFRRVKPDRGPHQAVLDSEEQLRSLSTPPVLAKRAASMAEYIMCRQQGSMFSPCAGLGLCVKACVTDNKPNVLLQEGQLGPR
jgi:hypothetical protein